MVHRRGEACRHEATGRRIGVALALALAAAPPAAGRPVEETSGSRADVPAATWQTVLAAGGKAKIWAQADRPDDVAKARAIATELTDHIWPTLTQLFWEPAPDEGFEVRGLGAPYTIDALEGAGPQLDIYLVHYPGNQGGALGEGGYCHAAFPGRSCGESPRYVTLESDRPLGGKRGFGILNTLAHELMHAIVQAVPWQDQSCSRYNWIDEATATWAEHFVYRNAQSEHRRAVRYLADTHQPLDFEIDVNDERHYGLYLLPLELELRDRLLAMPKMWRNFETQRPLAGIEAAIGEKYATFFPRFMLDNWNRGSVGLYREKDGLTEGARVDENANPQVVALGADGRFEKPIPLDQQYLSSTYRYFRFVEEVRAITFENGLLGHPHAKAWAIEKIDGVWQKPRELSEVSGATWCRDRPDENLDELVLAFGNTNWRRADESPTSLRVRGKHQLSAFAHGCTAWEGTTSARYTMESDGMSLTETSRAHVRFEPDPEFEQPGRPVQYWRAVSGQVHWTAEMTGACHGSFSGTFPIAVDADGNRMGTLEIYDAAETATPDPPGLRYSGGGAAPPPGQEPSFAWSCPGYELPSTLLMALGWFGTAVEGHPLPPGATTLAGRYEATDLPPGSRLIWTWDLHQSP